MFRRAVTLALAFVLMAPSPPAGSSARSYHDRLEALGQRYQAEVFLESPSFATDSGIHTYDTQVGDYTARAQRVQYAKMVGFRNQLAGLEPPSGASIHDRIDYLLLRADLEGEWWSDTVLKPLERNPTVYEGECTDDIFSLVKKPFASDEVRVRDAIARMNACPGVLAAGRANLTDTVREFAQIASEDIAGGDGLFTRSLNLLAAHVEPATQVALHAAQTRCLNALHAYKAWLDANMHSFHAGGFTVGKRQYDWYLRRVLLLPYDSDEIGQIGATELLRDRALQTWETNRDAYGPPGVSQPAFASKAAFLRFYQRQTQTLIAFVKSHHLVDLPPYLGAFHIVQIPSALAAVYPGGFMNPPGMFDKDSEGFYFVPDYDPTNTSFFAAQARQAVMPVLGHEGIPGHFLQFTYAYHNPDFIRHIQQDEVFAEGWAFYGEEMLMRNGLYDNDPASRNAVLHLMRHRATRVGVDIGLATGSMTLPQAIAYFQTNAGIDAATARGEAIRFAMYPGQAIDYLIGKMQIESLLASVQDRQGSAFSLRLFHDRLLSYGTVPYSTVRWEWLNDPSWIAPALDPIAPVSMEKT